MTRLTPGAIHAISTLAGLDLGEKTVQIAADMLKHKSPAVRRAALQTLGPAENRGRIKAIFDVLTDASPEVRLAGLLAYSDIIAAQDEPANAAAIALANILNQHPEQLRDPQVRDGFVVSAAADGHNFLLWLPFAGCQPTPEVLDVLSIVSEHVARTDGRANAGTILVNCQRKNLDAKAVEAIVQGFARGWPTGSRLDVAGSEDELEALMAKLPQSSQGSLVKLVANWGSERFREMGGKVVGRMLQQIDDESRPSRERIELARQIIDFQPDRAASVEALLERIGPQTPGWRREGPDLRRRDQPGNGRAHHAAGENGERNTRCSLGRRRCAAKSNRIDPHFVERAVERRATARRPCRSINVRHSVRIRIVRFVTWRRKVLAKTGGLTNPDRQKVLAELMPVCDMPGTKDAGKAVFKKHCSKCHIHSGEGNKVGPELTGMAVHPKKELLAHILDPSASVEGNYRLYSVVTDEGKAINGMLASETRTALEFFDAEGKRQSVLRDEVDEMVASRKSVMPEGFEKLISKQEFADLLTFLTARGKFLPIDISKVASIASDRGMFVNKQADVERLIFPDWKPKMFKNVPFVLIDPKEGTVPNTILLHGPATPLVQRMPKRVEVPLNGPARAIHMLGGVGGWAYPYSRKKTVSVIVRLHYADGSSEDHELRNGEHFADYIRVENVPTVRTGVQAARSADPLSRRESTPGGCDHKARTAKGSRRHCARRHGDHGRGSVAIQTQD